MMHARTAIVLLLLTGCRAESVISGTLLDADDADLVWHSDDPAREEIDGIGFRLRNARGDTVDLRFARGSREAGWMRVIGLPRGAELTLHGVWFEGGRAFPSSVQLSRGRSVQINGLRMAPAERIPTTVAAEGVLLARSRAGDALVMRPESERLPDLKVLIVPITAIRSEDGEPASLDRLELGDSLEIRGRSASGYVVADEVVVPRRNVAEEESESQRGSGVAAQRSQEGPRRSQGTERIEPGERAERSERSEARETQGPPGRREDRPGRRRARGRDRDD